MFKFMGVVTFLLLLSAAGSPIFAILATLVQDFTELQIPRGFWQPYQNINLVLGAIGCLIVCVGLGSDQKAVLYDIWWCAALILGIAFLIQYALIAWLIYQISKLHAL